MFILNILYFVLEKKKKIQVGIEAGSQKGFIVFGIFELPW